MGLDMYFEGTFSTRAFSERDPNNYKRENVEIDLDFEATLESIGFENAPVEFSNWNYYSINIPIAYWRKVSCIHNWFVKNVQGGKDDCDRYYVGDEKIKELVEERQRRENKHYEEMRAMEKKIRMFYEALGWSLPINKINTLERFF